MCYKCHNTLLLFFALTGQCSFEKIGNEKNMSLIFAQIRTILSIPCRSVSIWFHFSSPRGTSINNSNNTGLLEIKSSALFYQKCLHFTFILRKFSLELNFGLTLFFPSTLKISFHYLLASIISDEKL